MQHLAVLRQVALKLYKTEINALRTRVHHVSLERDNLRNSLNRTLEENKKLIKEGDEHADLVQQQSEQRLKYVTLTEYYCWESILIFIY